MNFIWKDQGNLSSNTVPLLCFECHPENPKFKPLERPHVLQARNDFHHL